MAGLTKILNWGVLVKILIVVLLGFIIYLPALNGEFISDDYRLVAVNPAIVQYDGVGAVWHSFNTRLLVGLTYALTYRMHQLDAFGYHLFSLIFHLINTVLVYGFCRQTLMLVKDSMSVRDGFAFRVSALAAVIFLCHPVQTQAVCAIAQRGTLMVCTFYLLAHILYIHGRVRAKPLCLWLVFIPLVLGFVSKETMLTVGVSLCVYEWYFLRGNPGIPKARPGWLIGYLMVSVIFPLMFFQNKPNADINFRHLMGLQLFDWNVFLTEINVLTTYLRLFIAPVNLKSDYYYPVTQSVWEPRLWLSVGILAVMLILAVKWYQRRRLLSFCILWFFLTKPIEFFGVSFGLRNLIYENWLYLTMVGLCLGGAYIVCAALRQPKPLLAVSALLTVTMSFMTFRRAQVWQYEIGHYRDLVKKEPAFPSAYLGLSDAYKRKGNIPKAIEALQGAVRVKPDFPHAHNNLGILYAAHGEDEKALFHFMRVVQSDPGFFGVYQNLGYLHFLRGEYAQAVAQYKNYLYYRPRTPDCYYYIGLSYLQLKDREQAREYLLEARRLYDQRQQQDKITDIDRRLNTL